MKLQKVAMSLFRTNAPPREQSGHRKLTDLHEARKIRNRSQTRQSIDFKNIEGELDRLRSS